MLARATTTKKAQITHTHTYTHTRHKNTQQTHEISRLYSGNINANNSFQQFSTLNSLTLIQKPKQHAHQHQHEDGPTSRNTKKTHQEVNSAGYGTLRAASGVVNLAHEPVEHPAVHLLRQTVQAVGGRRRRKRHVDRLTLDLDRPIIRIYKAQICVWRRGGGG